MYTGIQIFLIVFAWFFFIETRGYTLEEAALLFDGKEAVERAANQALYDPTLVKGQVDHVEGGRDSEKV